MLAVVAAGMVDSERGKEIARDVEDRRDQFYEDVLAEAVEQAYEALAVGDPGDYAQAVLVGYQVLTTEIGIRASHDPDNWPVNVYRDYEEREVKDGYTLSGFRPLAYCYNTAKRDLLGNKKIARPTFDYVATEAREIYEAGYPIYDATGAVWLEPTPRDYWDGKAPRVAETMETLAIAAGYLEPYTDDTYTVGEDFEESPVDDLRRRRREQNRDLKVIITARDSQTGTGKTTLAVRLAKRWDVSGDDWTADRALLDPSDYNQKYDDVPAGAVLLLDEAEQAADNRRSMSQENVDLSHTWAAKRYRQVSTILTLPSVTMLDKRLKELADIRINVTRRGHARAYRVKVDDHGGDLFERHICNVEWDDLDGDPAYEAVERKKAARMEGRDGDDQDGAAGTVDPEAARTEARDDLLREVYAEADDVTQRELAEAADLSRSRVADILSQD